MRRLLAALVLFWSPLFAADPVIESVTETTDTSPTTSAIVDLPSTVEPDDLLLLLIRFESDSTSATLSSPWVTLDVTGGAAALSGYLDADGTEDGGTVTVTLGAAPASWAAQVFRISNWDTGQSPEGNGWTNPNIGGTSATPALASISPSWGAADNLFITVLGHTDDGASVSAVPGGWTKQADTLSDAGANAKTTLSSAYLFDSASTTVDPDSTSTWSLSEAEVNFETTIAIKGGAGLSAAAEYYRRLLSQ